VVPIKDAQPAKVKLTLLPFQLESLHWMKKQEKSIWHGGMLAVRIALELSSHY
jgi:DNA repair protein RAD16